MSQVAECVSEWRKFMLEVRQIFTGLTLHGSIQILLLSSGSDRLCDMKVFTGKAHEIRHRQIRFRSLSYVDANQI